MRAIGVVAAMLLLATPRCCNRGGSGGFGAGRSDAGASLRRAHRLPSWERVFPGLRILHSERLDAQSARVRQQTRVVGRPVACTMAATLRPAELRLDLVLDEREPHDVAELASFWRIAPMPGGGASIELRVVTRSGLPIPAFVERGIVEASTRRTLADLVRALDGGEAELHADTWDSPAAN